LPGVEVTNEPQRFECGAPDFILKRKGIPVGYIEAKDIGKPLDGRQFLGQFERYRTSLRNLIITDYLEFRLFRDRGQSAAPRGDHRKHPRSIDPIRNTRASLVRFMKIRGRLSR
jgi:hypothetical protein